ncbi:MAG: hypothetical protein K0S26_819 [Bacteroidota bacterium]|jgi:hypothetical protein|nr:hypothetical protein [Bacteroidota bacterium]
MKKIALLIGVLSIASFSSCKKIRTCKCTMTAYGTTQTQTQTSASKLNDKDAKLWCEGNTYSGSGGEQMTCELAN